MRYKTEYFLISSGFPPDHFVRFKTLDWTTQIPV